MILTFPSLRFPMYALFVQLWGTGGQETQQSWGQRLVTDVNKAWRPGAKSVFKWDGGVTQVLIDACNFPETASPVWRVINVTHVQWHWDSQTLGLSPVLCQVDQHQASGGASLRVTAIMKYLCRNLWATVYHVTSIAASALRPSEIPKVVDVLSVLETYREY